MQEVRASAWSDFVRTALCQSQSRAHIPCSRLPLAAYRQLTYATAPACTTIRSPSAATVRPPAGVLSYATCPGLHQRTHHHHSLNSPAWIARSAGHHHHHKTTKKPTAKRIIRYPPPRFRAPKSGIAPDPNSPAASLSTLPFLNRNTVGAACPRTGYRIARLPAISAYAAALACIFPDKCVCQATCDPTLKRIQPPAWIARSGEPRPHSNLKTAIMMANQLTGIHLRRNTSILRYLVASRSAIPDF